ncbi:Ig-like domain-containing protein, partial [Mesorhizobium sp. M1252]|uniref:Ig-like domain-containing protein n=1 Tax=Mesorhizobium sp. M1252 TaxID=2957073 RepID=UPI00333DF296
DRVNPTVTVDIVDTQLSDTDSSSQVTFTFSEAPTNFSEADISVSAGLTLVAGSLAQDAGNPLLWTATVTANDAFDGTGTVTVGTAWQDTVGNTGIGDDDTVAIDRVNPTVTVDIVDTQLSDTDSSSQVTFTFSEAPGASFTVADITATHGTVTGLTATADPLVFTATFTADDGFAGQGSVSVTAGSYTDTAGNTGSA